MSLVADIYVMSVMADMSAQISPDIEGFARQSNCEFSLIVSDLGLRMS
jgi:hypothetical protein